MKNWLRHRGTRDLYQVPIDLIYKLPKDAKETFLSTMEIICSNCGRDEYVCMSVSDNLLQKLKAWYRDYVTKDKFHAIHVQFKGTRIVFKSLDFETLEYTYEKEYI